VKCALPACPAEATYRNNVGLLVVPVCTRHMELALDSGVDIEDFVTMPRKKGVA
jgi:hypothetical protein